MEDEAKTFLVRAQIPVYGSEDFANEIRKTTSGSANPILRKQHFEVSLIKYSLISLIYSTYYTIEFKK